MNSTPDKDELHIGVLTELREGIPDYEGDDPRASHYRSRRDALAAAIQALRTPSPVADEAVVERVKQAIRDKLDLSDDLLVDMDDNLTAVARAALQQVQTVDGLERVRERCARIAEAIDSARGNEAMIAAAIRQIDVRPETEG